MPKTKQNLFLLNKNNKAFTLIELLVVIAIISLLSAVILNSVADSKMRANDTKISEDLRQVKIAVEMYFVDNRDYPPTTSPTGYIAPLMAVAQPENQWADKLSFFIKTAEASSIHTTPLCANFDNMAQTLVNKKYLASVPVHPYDNDAKGICYKAVKATSTLVSYAVLTTQVTTTGGATINKRAGFIAGDASQSGVNDVITAMAQYPSERTYPSGLDGSTNPVDTSGNVSSIDQIIGITGGLGGSTSATEGVITDTTATCLYGDYLVSGVKTCALEPFCTLGETYDASSGCGYATSKQGAVSGYSVNGTFTAFATPVPASCSKIKANQYFDPNLNACGITSCPGGSSMQNNICIPSAPIPGL